jgi:hypothetical protein
MSLSLVLKSARRNCVWPPISCCGSTIQSLGLRSL